MRISSEICRRCCQFNELNMPLVWTDTHYVSFGRIVKLPKGRRSVMFCTKFDRTKPCLFRFHDTKRDGKAPDFLQPYELFKWLEKTSDEKKAESIFEYIDRFDDFNLLENCQFYLEQQIMAANQSHIPE